MKNNVGSRIIQIGIFAAIAAAMNSSSSPALADVRLPAIFADNMVLQRDQPIAIWGTASPGESVSIKLNGVSAQTQANADGRWSTKLAAQSAGGPYDVTVAASNTVMLHNVLIGDVWLCAGQSNMEGTVSHMLHPDEAEQAIAASDHPDIRLFTVKEAGSPTPLTDNIGNWAVCGPASVGNFSATAYFFGRELESKLHMPIGLVCSAVGGTNSEAWTSVGALEHDPSYETDKETWEAKLDDYPTELEDYQDTIMPAWTASVAQSKVSGTPVPSKPLAPQGPNSFNRPGNLFNAMIAPLIPLSIRGVAWYQGESNSDSIAMADQYKTLFPTLIRDWRHRWGNENLPFVFCEIANYGKGQVDPVESASWTITRETETKALSMPNTGMAVLIDIADNSDNIHPHNKQETGRRLALAALSSVYNVPVDSSGPMYRSMTIEGNQARIRFSSADGGLVAKTMPASSTEGNLTGFAIAGSDHVYQWADAKIDGDSVVVSSPQIAKPVFVRYDWASNPIGNLYNGNGLPANPFRTDNNAAEPLPATAIDEGVLAHCLVAGRFGAQSVQAALDTDFIGEASIAPREGQQSSGKIWRAATVLNKDRYNMSALAETGPYHAFATYFSFSIHCPSDFGSAPNNQRTFPIVVMGMKATKLFVNGSLVPTTQTGPWAVDGSQNIYASLPLVAGWNRVLIKVASENLVGKDGAMLAVRFPPRDQDLSDAVVSAVQTTQP